MDCGERRSRGVDCVQRIKEMTGDEGFNALTEQYRGPGGGRGHRSRQGGPFGPANAASVAALLLTTEAVISRMPETGIKNLTREWAAAARTDSPQPPHRRRARMSPVRPNKKPISSTLPLPPFDLQAFLDSAGVARTIRKYNDPPSSFRKEMRRPTCSISRTAA